MLDDHDPNRCSASILIALQVHQDSRASCADHWRAGLAADRALDLEWLFGCVMIALLCAGVLLLW